MDVLSQLEVLAPEFQRLALETRVGQLDNQTPCANWVVRDLFEHLIRGKMFFYVIRGEEPPEEVVNLYLTQSSPDRPSLGIPDESLAAAAAEEAGQTVATFRSPGALERTITVHLGDVKGEVFAGLATIDLLVHSWDLATATGRVVEAPDEAVEGTYEFAITTLQPEWRTPYTFGPEVEPPAGASTLERLVAFSGRTVPKQGR